MSSSIVTLADAERARAALLKVVRPWAVGPDRAVAHDFLTLRLLGVVSLRRSPEEPALRWELRVCAEPGEGWLTARAPTLQDAMDLGPQLFARVGKFLLTE